MLKLTNKSNVIQIKFIAFFKSLLELQKLTRLVISCQQGYILQEDNNVHGLKPNILKFIVQKYSNNHIKTKPKKPCQVVYESFAFAIVKNKQKIQDIFLPKKKSCKTVWLVKFQFCLKRENNISAYVYKIKLEEMYQTFLTSVTFER